MAKYDPAEKRNSEWSATRECELAHVVEAAQQAQDRLAGGT